MTTMNTEDILKALTLIVRLQSRPLNIVDSIIAPWPKQQQPSWLATKGKLFMTKFDFWLTMPFSWYYIVYTPIEAVNVVATDFGQITQYLNWLLITLIKGKMVKEGLIHIERSQCICIWIQRDAQKPCRDENYRIHMTIVPCRMQQTLLRQKWNERRMH